MHKASPDYGVGDFAREIIHDLTETTKDENDGLTAERQRPMTITTTSTTTISWGVIAHQ
jgi:hypothetical protein